MPLSDMQRKDAEECFRKFDRNGDGQLTIQEMVPLVRSLGWKCSDGEICDWFLKKDKNNDRKISLEEFLAVIDERPQQEITEANLRRTFKEFDKDGSGTISPSELKQTLAKCQIQISDSEAKEFIRQADKSGDGQVDIEEFLAIWGH